MVHLMFGVGELACALPLEHVTETMRPLPVNAVDDAPDFVLGVSVIRGEAVVVLDAGRLLEREPVEAKRFVTLRVGARSVALAVSRVEGVARLSPAPDAGTPPLLSEALDVVSLLTTRDENLLMVLRTMSVFDRAPTVSETAS